MSARVAFVAGAGSGICRETSILFGRRGYSVVALDLNKTGAQETADLVSSTGSECLAVEVDVAIKSSVQAGVEAGIKRFGRADILVCGAGYAQSTPLLEITEEAWDRMLAVHLKGPFLLAQAILPHMRDGNYGRIVVISSQNAETGSTNHVHYAAAKAGVLGLVRSLARDCGRWGVTVNAVLPGATDTPLNSGISPERLKMLANTPVGRMGQPEDIAYAIGYLASEEAGYTNGAYLRVNGGL